MWIWSFTITHSTTMEAIMFLKCCTFRDNTNLAKLCPKWYKENTLLFLKLFFCSVWDWPKAIDENWEQLLLFSSERTLSTYCVLQLFSISVRFLKGISARDFQLANTEITMITRYNNLTVSLSVRKFIRIHYQRPNSFTIFLNKPLISKIC